MLSTALEIIGFIVVAAVIGVILGWVLRATLGREQAEISELRAQIRQMKKASRESKAENTVASATQTRPVTEKSVPKVKSVQKAKKDSARKSLAEREAEQVAGKKAFVEVASRIGKAETEDNLVKIYGIGKRYAEMLNELGISSYQQISVLKKADVRSLAAALGVHDDRLETEDWVGGAKKLLKAKKQT